MKVFHFLGGGGKHSSEINRLGTEVQTMKTAVCLRGGFVNKCTSRHVGVIEINLSFCYQICVSTLHRQNELNNVKKAEILLRSTTDVVIDINA
jgi:hypothetical protein